MDEYVREFVDEAEEAITRLNNLLLDLERSPDDEAVLEEIFRTAHTLKGNAGAMGLDRASDLAHAMEDLLDAVRAGDVAVTPERMDTLFAAVDCLETMVDEVAAEGAIRTDPTETIESLRTPLAADTIDATPPAEDERAAILARFSPPSDPDHDAFLVRMAIADSADLNNGLVVVEALNDAFDLIGTDPSRTAIENEEHGNRIDAVFGTAVGEAAISAALEPVGAVEAFSILAVTDEIEDGSDESDSFSPIDDDLSADISSDEANEMTVDDLLDEFTELDDIDALAEEVDDVSEFEDIGDAGSFDDIIPEPSSESADADSAADEPTESAEAAEESESVEDAGAVFDELKEEVDMVGFDELQDELDELEFEEFDEEEIGMAELLGDDVDVDDPAFLDVDEPDSPSEAERGASSATTTDSVETEPDSPTGVSTEAAGAVEFRATTESDEVESEAELPSADEPASAAEPDAEPSPEDGAGSPEESADYGAETSSTTSSADQQEPSLEDAETATESSAFADELFSGGDDVSATTGSDPGDTDDAVGGTTADRQSADPVDPDAPAAGESDARAPGDDAPAQADADGDTIALSPTDGEPAGDAPEPERDDWASEFDSDDGTEPDDSGIIDESVTTDSVDGADQEADSGAVSKTDDIADPADVDETDVDPAPGASEGAERDDPVAFDLDEAADVPETDSTVDADEGDEATANEPVDATGEVTVDSDDETESEPGTADDFGDVETIDSAETAGTAAPADADAGDSVPDDGPDSAPADAESASGEEAAESGTADSSDRPPEADATESGQADDFGGEADAFDLSAGLDDLGTEFDETGDPTDAFGADSEATGFASESLNADETDGETSNDDGTEWEESEDALEADSVSDFDADLSFEAETAAGSDAALQPPEGFETGSDFDDGMDASDAVSPDDAGSFADAGETIDIGGTDFDSSGDEDSASGDEVLAELPEMVVPDIEVPSTASLETDADLEERAQSVRVDREQIDSLLQLVEGLVTSRVRLRTAVNDRDPYESIERELEELEDFTTELQETVMDVRLVPLQTVTNRLPRVVRDLAREQDKQVEFDQSAADVELDRGILDRIGDPLIHLVRNAVDHGIEDAETREEAGKPPEGTIELGAERTQNRVRIEISDDGKGLDADRLRDAAVEADILGREEADDLSDEEAYDLVFHSGLSTADQVTDVSGRGVGMDVVRRTIDELSGTVSIDSEPGEGTTVRMTLPVSVAVDDVVFVESGGEQFGVPVDVVQGIADGAHVAETDEGLVFDTDGESLPVIDLGDALETGEPRVQDPDGMVVRIRDDVREVGLKCDVVHARREVVVNPFEGFMRNIPGVSGATVRGRGEVITILDVSTI